MSCVYNDHEGPSRFVRVRIANGSEQIRRRCDTCKQLLGRIYARNRFDPDVIAAMTLAEDWTNSRPPCVVCGARGTDIHHWAPRALFGDESDLWPTAWLCPPCHQRWHAAMEMA